MSTQGAKVQCVPAERISPAAVFAAFFTKLRLKVAAILIDVGNMVLPDNVP